MLPFTIYQIPEGHKDKTSGDASWLNFIVQQPVSGEKIELLQKISAALNADFQTESQCMPAEYEGTFPQAADMKSGTRLIISFGVPPSSLGLWIDIAGPGIRKLESFSFILTLPLDALSKNPGAKKELWKHMQIYLEKHKDASAD